MICILHISYTLLPSLIVPQGLLSVSIYLLLHYYVYETQFNHPYAIGVLVSSVSFLIIFRANYGYQRYWEACTAVHQLMSKWMDASVFASVFHLQSDHNKDMRPQLL